MDIRKIKSGDEEILSNFFEVINSDEGTVNFFHPHPFTKKYAKLLVAKIKKSKDLYFIVIRKNKIVGYSMLRGWDEGYNTPSFGICIHPEYQWQGLGKLLTDYTLKKAKGKKADKVMLKVYKNNEKAYQLYEKIGFEFSKETEDKKQWVGFLNFK